VEHERSRRMKGGTLVEDAQMNGQERFELPRTLVGGIERYTCLFLLISPGKQEFAWKLSRMLYPRSRFDAFEKQVEFLA